MVRVKLGDIEVNTDQIQEPINIKKVVNSIAMSGRNNVHNFGCENQSWSLSCWVLTKAEYAIIRTFTKSATSFIFTDDEGNTHENVSIDSLTPRKHPYDYVAFDIDISEDY